LASSLSGAVSRRFWRCGGAALDDFFITYRYALHLAGGQGFVFNPGQRVFGLTNPGLAILLAASSPPPASVGYYEVGALGYFSDRAVIDLLGIATPELTVFERLPGVALPPSSGP
jgi:hypothetical protein